MAERLATVPRLSESQILVCEAGDLAGLAAHRRLEADARRLGTFFSQTQAAPSKPEETGGLESVTIGGAIEALNAGLNTLDAVIALGPRIQPLLQLFRTERTYRREKFHFDRLAVLAAMTGPLQPRCAGISALALSTHSGTFPQLDQALRARGQTTRPAGGDRPAKDWDQACDALDQLREAVAGIARPNLAPNADNPNQTGSGAGAPTPPVASATAVAPVAATAVAESLHRGAHLAAALKDNAWPLVIEPLSVELIREDERSWRTWFQGANSRHHCRVACAMLLFNPQLNVLCADIFEGGLTRDSNLISENSTRG